MLINLFKYKTIALIVLGLGLALLLTGCGKKLNGAEITGKEFMVSGEKVIVGGSMLGADKFVPEVKLEKWGDETHIRVWTDDEVEDKAREENGKVKVKSKDGKKEYNFYPTDEGFEYEVILLEKPKSNIIELNIELKDLDCWYQPELTQEEIDDGMFRPENVVGSYACYHATKKNHIEGQTNYMAGKAFHIYRPQMVDAGGNKVWGELNIENGILSVTIPQDFIDKAAFPIKHATGLEFGYETGGSSFEAITPDDVFGSVFPSGGAGEVTKISASIWENSTGSYSFKSIIVLHSNLNIISDGVTDASGIPTAYTQTFTDTTFSTNPTISNTNYVLFIIHNDPFSPAVRINYDAGNTDQGHYDASNDYTTPTNPTDANHNDNEYSIYATYSAGEPPADTCTPPASGDWYVSASDNCYLGTDTYITGALNLLNDKGPGSFNLIDGATLSVEKINSTSTSINVEAGGKIKFWTAI